MDNNETPLEAAQRRFAEAEARVKEQAARVADLAHWGQDTTQARATLAVFETTLRLMLEDLIRERERAARSQP